MYPDSHVVQSLQRTACEPSQVQDEQTQEQEREFIFICCDKVVPRDQANRLGKPGSRTRVAFSECFVLLIEWIGENGVRTATGSIDGGKMYAERVDGTWISASSLKLGLGDGAVFKEIILG
jgi:hypothetical protein